MKSIGLFVVLILVPGQADQQFDVPCFGDQFPFPFGIGEVIELLGLVLFLHQTGIPRSGNDHHVRGQPIRSLEIGRISRGFRREPVKRQLLIDHLQDVFKRHLKNIGKDPAAARFGDRPGGKLVRGGIDVIDFDAGKALLEYRQNSFRIDLREGGIEINYAALLNRRLVQLVPVSGRPPSRPPQESIAQYETPDLQRNLVESRNIFLL